MIRLSLSALLALRKRPALRRAFFVGLAILLTVTSALFLWQRVRAAIEEGARLEIRAQTQKVIIDEIKSLPNPPRPVRDEFLECLRSSQGAGCF